MVLTTIVITMITLLFVYIDYMQGRLFNFTLAVLCILDAVLIISVLILQFENTKIETWVNKKWDQLDFETQEGIRCCVLILVILVMVIAVIISLNSIHMRS